MAMEEVREVYGPSFQMELTLFDHSRPAIYPMSNFVFRLPQDYDQEHIVSILNGAYQRLVNKIPWLACEVKENKGRIASALSRASSDWASSWLPAASSLLLLKSRRPRLLYTLHPGASTFAIRRTSNLSYATMQPEDFVPDLFPELPRKQNGVDVFPASGLKAIFTQDGYLLLAFGSHHALADGQTNMKILEWLADEIRAESLGPQEKMAEPIPGVFDKSQLLDLTPTGPVPSWQVPPQPCFRLFGLLEAIFIFAKITYRFSILGRPGNSTQKTFSIDTDALKTLKPTAPVGTWVTTHDLACALAWRGLMSARLNKGIIQQSADVSFAMPACVRRHLPPSSTPQTPYLGNGATLVEASIPIRELLGPGGVMAGALAIRRAVTATNLDSVRDSLALCVASSDLMLVQPRMLSKPMTEIMFLTSRFKYSPWEWDWGSAIGSLESLHSPHGHVAEGIAVVLPVNKDGRMTMTIGLEQRCIEPLLDDPVWSEYARMVERKH